VTTFLKTKSEEYIAISDSPQSKAGDISAPRRVDPQLVEGFVATLLAETQKNNIEDLNKVLDKIPISDEIKKPLQDLVNKADYETLKVNVESEINKSNLSSEVQENLIVELTKATGQAKNNFETVSNRTAELKNNEIGFIAETHPSVVKNQLEKQVNLDPTSLITQTENKEKEEKNKPVESGPQGKQDYKFHFIQSIKQAFNNINLIFGRTLDVLNERQQKGEEIKDIPTTSVTIESPDIPKTTSEYMHAAMSGEKANAISGALLCFIGMAMCIYMAVNPSPEKQLERAVSFAAKQAVKRGIDPDLVIAAVEKMTVTVHHGKNPQPSIDRASVAEVLKKEGFNEKLKAELYQLSEKKTGKQKDLGPSLRG
jgi:hypothetical protein